MAGSRARDRRVVRTAAAAVILAAGVLSGCGGDDGNDTGPRNGAVRAQVTVRAFNFQPDPLVVRAGAMVTFVNDDAIDHTVTAGTRAAPEPDRFDGELPTKGARFELTLDDPGVYEYFCRIHPGPGMTATITVE
jgi:plastocyanin